MHIYDYIYNFSSESFYYQINEARFKNITEGCLHLLLAEYNNTTKKLDKIDIQSKSYYVMSGTFLNPYASSIVRETRAAGLLLDTTWKLMQHYVVSIPTVVINNVGLPLGFSFGLIEDSEIFNSFFNYFEKNYNFKITNYLNVCESDQGTGLRKAVKEQGMTHLKYLRHMLVNIGKKRFSEQIGNLISVSSNKDFEELKKLHTDLWLEITDEKLISNLEINLKQGWSHIQNTKQSRNI